MKAAGKNKIHQESLCAAGIWQASDPEQEIYLFLGAAHPVQVASSGK